LHKNYQIELKNLLVIDRNPGVMILLILYKTFYIIAKEGPSK